MIKIEFEYIYDKDHTFKDAIVLEDNHNLTDDQIEQIKQQRIENWLTYINPSIKE